MADNLQEERKRIAELLRRYESANVKNSGRGRDQPNLSGIRRYDEYEYDEEPSDDYEWTANIPERRRPNDRLHRDYFEDDLGSLEEKASEPESNKHMQEVSVSDSSRRGKYSTTEGLTKARPRYQAPTASSRIRVLEQEEENRLNAERDTPAHEEVYPAPLHWAARLGIPSA